MGVRGPVGSGGDIVTGAPTSQIAQPSAVGTGEEEVSDLS